MAFKVASRVRGLSDEAFRDVNRHSILTPDWSGPLGPDIFMRRI